ncbi:PepSY domain-containing protein [Ginsengibacter hankyongi]|uniref:PepSY domain-containing protein n=1 Tax=Ginsengibacter hankyongi TaxID=2607284 RepID=A0A5J5IBD0_9BACT|nr:PepSY-associated TM helix domain-containing protein [Ginsengibacter hankyongi]KAA9035497.1 PepSY domain-containing protein [Ginsengibacter hankyongi]
MKKYYPSVRTLHLYFGLFISPFVLIFSISVIIFNHPGLINRLNPVQNPPTVKTKLDKIPYDSTDLQTAKAIIRKLNINGEIDFISKSDSSISFPVNKPGLKTFIAVNTINDSVLITRKQEGTLRATTYLHSMPGPHNASIRGNSVFLKIWRILTDAVVYVLLFLTFSGVFLWYMLKAERVIGLYAIALGVLFFISILLFIF